MTSCLLSSTLVNFHTQIHTIDQKQMENPKWTKPGLFSCVLLSSFISFLLSEYKLPHKRCICAIDSCLIYCLDCLILFSRKRPSWKLAVRKLASSLSNEVKCNVENKMPGGSKQPSIETRIERSSGRLMCWTSASMFLTG